MAVHSCVVSPEHEGLKNEALKSHYKVCWQYYEHQFECLCSAKKDFQGVLFIS